VTAWGGPAAVTCAARLLGKAATEKVRDPESLAEVLAALEEPLSERIQSSPADPSTLLALAQAWGMSTTTRRESVPRIHRDVVRSIQAGLPVLLPWHPRRLGEAAPGGQTLHWGMIVEWPDDGEGDVAFTDSCLAGGHGHGLRGRWTLRALQKRRALPWRPAWLFLR